MQYLCLGFLYALITYVLAGTSLFLLFKSLTAMYDKTKYDKILYISFLGIGPITISWLLEHIMYYFPHHSSNFYILFIVLIWIVFLCISYFLNRNSIQILINIFKDLFWLDIFLYLVLFFLLLSIVLLPVIGNDSAQYFYISDFIANAKNFTFYPMINTNYHGYFPWTHPAGYVGLLTWGHLFELTDQHFFISKTINAFYAVVTYMLMSELLVRYGKINSKLVALLLFAAPIYCNMILLFHIDVFRILLFFIPFVFMSILFATQNTKYIYFIAFSLAMSAHAHSIGILSIFFFGIIILLHGRQYLTFKNVAISLMIILVVLFPRYYHSYKTLGYIIGDKTPIWSLDFIGYKNHLIYTRDFSSLSSKIFSGVLKGFTNVKLFGYIFDYWLFLILMLLVLSKVQTKSFFAKFKQLFELDKLFFISMFVIFLWYIATIVSVVFGSYSFIKNGRYLLTIYPFVVYAVSILTLEYVRYSYILFVFKYIIKCRILILIKNCIIKNVGSISTVVLLIILLFILTIKSQDRIMLGFRDVKFSKSYLAKSDFNKLLNRNQSSVETIDYIVHHTNKNDIFLIFRTSEFPLYVKRKFISLMDPKIIDIYKSKTDKEIYDRFKSHDISYVYLPRYSLPQIYNTQLSTFLFNPDYSKLMIDNKGYKLYKINHSKKNFNFMDSGILKKKKFYLYKKITNYKHITSYRKYKNRYDTDFVKIGNNAIYKIYTNLNSTKPIDIIIKEIALDNKEIRSMHIKDIDKEDNIAFYVPSAKKIKKIKIVYNAKSNLRGVKIIETKIFKSEKQKDVEYYSDKIILSKKYYENLQRIDIQSSYLYYITSGIKGLGLVQMYAMEYNKQGKLISVNYLNSLVANSQIKNLDSQYIPSKKASSFSLFYKKKTKNKCEIFDVVIYKINKGK